MCENELRTPRVSRVIVLHPANACILLTRGHFRRSVTSDMQRFKHLLTYLHDKDGGHTIRSAISLVATVSRRHTRIRSMHL